MAADYSLCLGTAGWAYGTVQIPNSREPESRAVSAQSIFTHTPRRQPSAAERRLRSLPVAVTRVIHP
jgi:hypothetical protein